MPHHTLPLHADDISSFARALARQLRAAHERQPQPPGHQELLNMLARAAGHRNFQSLSARRPAPAGRVHREEPPADPALSDTAVRVLRQFDEWGRLKRWPIRYAVQRMMLWGLWMRFESRRKYTEREVNDILNAWHLYGDHCTLRRELVTMKLLERKSDGSQYWKVPARPDEETMVLLRALRARSP
jgi:hypothetical protein